MSEQITAKLNDASTNATVCVGGTPIGCSPCEVGITICGGPSYCPYKDKMEKDIRAKVQKEVRDEMFSKCPEPRYGGAFYSVDENGKTNTMLADKVILATGGKSYPQTGSTGDGYKISSKLGHTITEIKPSLVPLTAKGKSLEICKEMQGLSLRNVAIKFLDEEKNKVIYKDFGEMLFTHFGVSGPTILSASAHLLRYKNVEELLKNYKIKLIIDLKPALEPEKLDLRLQRDFEKEKNKEFKNSLNGLLPQKMISPIVRLSGIAEEKQVNQITKEERLKLGHLLKNFTITISGFRPVEEAIITAGGINTKEINPKTMESKLVEGLFFAGEIIDVDAYTGGFNLQIAYSTGYTAGMH